MLFFPKIDQYSLKSFYYCIPLTRKWIFDNVINEVLNKTNWNFAIHLRA